MAKERKKLGLELSEDDKAVVSENVALSTAPTRKAKVAPTPKVKPEPEPERVTMASQDLRAYITPSSQLAAALQDELEKLPSKMRNLVSPPTILRKFLQEHDEELAQMFRDNNALK